MKLLLANHWEEYTQRLIDSLDKAGISCIPIVIQYDGKMPSGILNPFLYYTNLQYKIGRPVYYNRIKVPKHCEIRHHSVGVAHVLRGDETIAEILYYDSEMRLVHQVNWLNRQGKKLTGECYSVDGRKYCLLTFDKDGQVTQKRYLNEAGKEVIIHHLVSQELILRGEEKTHFFSNLTQFVQFFLEDITSKDQVAEYDEIYINHLGTALSVVKDMKNISSTLFWQENLKDEVPGNMDFILTQKTSVKRIVFHDLTQKDFVGSHYTDTPVSLSYLSPIESFEEKEICHKALILTYSDELIGIEEILNRLPDLQITIAALTMVSDKLHDLDNRYTNVTLIPQISNEEIAKLLKENDIYLDIHYGREVMDIISQAYRAGYFIVSMAPVVKHPRLELTFRQEEVRLLIATLAEFMSSDEKRAEWIQKNHEIYGPRTPASEYQRVLQAFNEIKN